MFGEHDKDSTLNNHQRGQRVRVLVVDDSPDILRTCATLLQHAGFEVRVALNGYDALKIAVEFKAHICLLDIGLPGLDGYEIARRLRADLAVQTMTIIAITAYGSEEDRRRAKTAGFDHHFVKPVNFFNLLSLIGSSSQPASDL
jgi:DNA-binding response OmpR family regulator